LPPKYVELFDSTNDVFKELLIKCNFTIKKRIILINFFKNHILVSRLQEDQQRRIMPKFDDEENKKIDKLIRENIREMTKKIKECEDNIKSMSLEKISTDKEKLVRDNMKQNLVSKLTDFTRKLKMNEEEYMKKYRELVGDDLNYQSKKIIILNLFKFFLDINTNQGSSKSGRTDENFLKFETSNDILVKRDNEINNLLNSINELSSIFKDFQTLVLEQGTILDRIDYNIETAFENTKKAHVDLEKANKNMEKNCARNSNLVLLVIIFIMSILIIFKYF
jgi:syntaxin 16